MVESDIEDTGESVPDVVSWVAPLFILTLLHSSM